MKHFTSILVATLILAALVSRAFALDRRPLADSFANLPLEIAATQQGTDVLLTWSLPGDHGLAGFHLWRASKHDPDFVRINDAFLYATTENSAQTYTYRDTPPAVRTDLRYRLQFIFSDGSVTSSAPFVLRYAPVRVLRTAKRTAPRFIATALAEPAPSPAVTASPLSITPAGRVKITVQTNGVYHLDSATLAPHFGLAEAEVQQLISNRLLRLSSQGVKHSWVPQRDHQGLFFYNPGHEDLYTRRNVFWLEMNSPGLIVPPRDGSVVNAPAERSITTNSVWLEDNRIHVYSAYYPLLDDYYIWNTFNAPASTSITFTAQHVRHDAAEATLTLRALGASSTGVPGEHEIEVRLNGQFVGSVSWERNVPYTGAMNFRPGLLTNGTNTITLSFIVNPLSGFSRVHLDWIHIKYPVEAVATLDALHVPAGSAANNMRVDGFMSDEIYALEIPGDHRIREVTGGTITTSEVDYSISFQSSGDPGADLFVLTPGGALAPLALAGVPSSPLLDTTNALDYLLITHPRLEAETRRLESFRTNLTASLRAKTVLIEDIYNNFSHGLEHPGAIQRFLSYAAQNWAVRPHAVLLAGSATLDYKNYRNTGMNLVPMMLTPTPYGPYSADNLLVDIDGEDGVPDFAVGRIPAVTLADMSNAVEKIIRHERAPETNLQALIFADLADPYAGNFPQSGQNTAALFPAGYTVQFDYRTNSTDTARIRGIVTNAINRGQVDLMTYFGHGGWDRLSGSKILANEHITTLQNSNHFPIALLTTCWPNRHEWASTVDLYIGKNLMIKPGRGAVATWGPSGETLNAYLENAARGFLNQLSANPALTLGEAAKRALAQISAERAANVYFLEIMTLLGDPLLTIK